MWVTHPLGPGLLTWLPGVSHYLIISFLYFSSVVNYLIAILTSSMPVAQPKTVVIHAHSMVATMSTNVMQMLSKT